MTINLRGLSYTIKQSIVPTMSTLLALFNNLELLDLTVYITIIISITYFISELPI